MKRIVIRCNADEEGGLGHFSRMFSLALELEALGDVLVTFCCRKPIASSARAMAAEYHFPMIELNPVRSMPQILLDSVGMNPDEPPDMVIVDEPYRYSNDVFKRIREVCAVVRVDHPWATKDTCDLLLVPNMHLLPEELSALEDEFGEGLLYGAEVVLLGREAIGSSPRRRKFTRPVKRIAFITGGSSFVELSTLYDMTTSLHQSLPKVERFYLVGQAVGRVHTSALHGLNPSGYLVGFSVDHIRSADLVVAMFGVSVYECLLLNVPVMAIGRERADMPETLSDTQCIGQLSWATEGAVTHGGSWPTFDREVFCSRIMEVVTEPGCLENMHSKAGGIVDRYGAERVATRLLEFF